MPCAFSSQIQKLINQLLRQGTQDLRELLQPMLVIWVQLLLGLSLMVANSTKQPSRLKASDFYTTEKVAQKWATFSRDTKNKGTNKISLLYSLL
jgi:hypothetical protein